MPKTKRRRSRGGHSTPYSLKPGRKVLGALNKDLGQSAKARASSSKSPSQRSRPVHSLLFLFDLETTGLSVYTDCITEIAGKVFDPPVDVKQATFSSLVHTDHNIPKIVQCITGITEEMLRDEEPLSTVLPEFLAWVSTTTEEVSKRTKRRHHPVLVAHNGYAYDFPLLLAEMERTPGLDPSTRILRNIHFSDTLTCMRQEKKSGNEFFQDQKLGLKNFYSHCFPERSYEAHRAMPDVEAMEEVLQHPQVSCIQEALVHNQRPASEMLSTLQARKQRRQQRFKKSK